MKISQKTVRNFIILSCIILVLFLAGCFSKTAVAPPLPEQATFTHYRVVTQAYKDANPAHTIEVAWRANSVEYSFKIFKSTNGGSFEELFDDGVEQSYDYQRKSCSCSFTDIEVKPGNQYSYYVLAYDDKGEVGKTETFSREIFLPPCTLKEPQNNAQVDTPIPTFSWNNQELTKYLTKSRAEGYLKTHLKVNDKTVQEEVWNMTMEDTTVDNVTYNLDDTGEPLENEHEYEWFHYTDAYDAQGNLIANAYSNSWHFHYKGPIKAVLMGKIMVPDTTKSISKDITGTIPLVDATITFTDSEGNTHTGSTKAQGQYVFPQVAPGTNYIITAVGEVDGQTIIYKDVVPSIALHEVFDAGIADAQSTALALVMEAMLAADPSLTPEDIVLDDILTADNFTSLVSTVEQVLNSCGNVTTNTGVAEAVEMVENELKPWIVNYREGNSQNDAFVNIRWNSCTNADDYKIYRSIDNTNFGELAGDYTLGSNGWYKFHDSDVTIVGGTYYYKVEAYDGSNLIKTSEIMTVDTWLPGITALSPINDEVVTVSNPTFSWQYEQPFSFPYGSFEFAGGGCTVNDATTDEIIWEIDLDDLNTFTITYNGPPLTEGNRYYWERTISAEDEEGNTCTTYCTGGFYYGYKPLNLQIRMNTYTNNKNSFVEINWSSVGDNYNYKIYRSKDEGLNFELLSSDYETTDGDFPYYFLDNTVTINNRYDYKIIAFGGEGGEISSEVVTVDTWFPSCTSFYPEGGSIVDGLQIEFSWDFPGLSFPYNGKVDLGGYWLSIFDEANGDEIYNLNEENNWTNSVSYDCSNLVQGHEYRWYYEFWGEDTEWNTGVSGGLGGTFYYGLVVPIVGACTGAGGGVQIIWVPIEGADFYRVYRTTNGVSDGVIFNSNGYIPDEYDETLGWWINQTIDWSYFMENGHFILGDNTAYSGNEYTYYVTADGGILTEETPPGKMVTVNTWFPESYLISPEENDTITDPKPLLEWFALGISNYPYGDITRGQTTIQVADETANREVWNIILDDLTTSSIYYNGEDLINGHTYKWRVIASGQNNEGEYSAESVAGTRTFTYQLLIN